MKHIFTKVFMNGVCIHEGTTYGELAIYKTLLERAGFTYETEETETTVNVKVNA